MIASLDRNNLLKGNSFGVDAINCNFPEGQILYPEDANHQAAFARPRSTASLGKTVPLGITDPGTELVGC